MVASASAGSAGDVESDKAHCFNRDANNKIEACTRLIEDPFLNDVTRGMAFAFRCSSYVTLRRMDQARGDCFSARHLAPEAPQSHFASYMFNFYSGDKGTAQLHLSEFRRALDAQNRREHELQERRRKSPVLEAARDSCFSEIDGRRPERVIAACDKFRGWTKVSDERAFASAVSCHFRSRLEHLELATRDCNRALQTDTPNAYAYFARGYLRQLQGDFGGSLTDFDQAAATGGLPREENGLMFLVRTVAERIRWERNRRSFTEAKGIDGTDRDEAVDADLERHAEEMKRRATEEATLLKRALERSRKVVDDPLHSETEFELCSPGKLSRSRERACLARELKRAPNQPSLLIRLANLHAESGNHGLAVGYWSRLISTAPEDSELYIARCRQRFVWGQQLRLALKDCSKAIGRSPENHVPLELRGSVHLRLKDIYAAISDYEAALSFNHMCSRCLYGRALARLALGDAKGHAADVARAKELSPTIEREFWNPFRQD